MAQRFLVVRYSFETLFAQQASDQFISDLESRPFLDSHTLNYRYAIGNFHVESFNGREFLRATYGQSILNIRTNAYDPEKKEWLPAEANGLSSPLVELLFDPQKHLIFIEKKSGTKAEQVAKRIEQIYNSATRSYGQLKIHFLTREVKIFDELKKFARIQRVTLRDLRPTNPDTLPEFEEIEKLLKETKSIGTKLEFKAEVLPEGDAVATSANPGLDINSKLITQALSLSAHGYGEASVVGFKEDKTRVEVKTRSHSIETSFDFQDPQVLNHVAKFIDTIQKGIS